MTEAEARTLLLRALGEVAPEVAVEAIDPALPLREQFDPDSLDFLNLVAALSDELGIDIPQRDYGSLDTPERATAYIGRIATSAAATVSSAPGGGSAIAVRPRSFVVLGSSSVVATVPPPPWRP